MTTPIKALLFDKDGTLFDFNATWAVWAKKFFLSLTGDPVEAARVGRHLGFDMQTGVFLPSSTIIAGTPNEIAREICKFYKGRTPQEIVAFANTTAVDAPQIEIVPLRPFMQTLRKRDIKLGVATNDSQVSAKEHLKRANILDLLDFVAGYDSGHGFKPEPGMQLAFCKKTGLPPGQVAMIGDSIHDLEAGRRAGMIRIGVLSGPASSRTLSPHADVILNSIREIPFWLDQRLNS